MALNKNFPYKTLHILLTKNLDKEVHEGTKKLIKDLRAVRKRGFLTKDELIEICRWKSPRAKWWILSNTPQSVKHFTKKAFMCKDEKEKMATLTVLHGVSVPMASAILMLTNPKRYGVIDVRVWEIIYQLGMVSTNRRATNFQKKNGVNC